jgi:hypothetical protein
MVVLTRMQLVADLRKNLGYIRKVERLYGG